MTQYCTTKQVFEFLNWAIDVPEFVSGSAPSFEEVDVSGTLANGSVIYLDHDKVIDGTLVLSYGASAASTTTLTLTTDYTIDLDKGKITITSAGATAIGSDKVYAEYYQYSSIDGRPGARDSVVSTLIDRAVAHFDKEMNRSYQASVGVLREVRTGQGRNSRRYYPYNMKPIVVPTTLTTTVDSSETGFVVGSTSGMTAGDYITIGGEVLSIDSVDSATALTVTRGELGSTGAAHTAGDELVNAAMEVSTTPNGSTPTWIVLSYSGDFYIDPESGLFTVLHNDITSEGLFVGQYPQKGTVNRVRLTYSYGSSSVPSDIEQACIEQVARWLSSASIAKALGEGQDGFVPRANEVLSEDVKAILKEHKLMRMAAI